MDQHENFIWIGGVHTQLVVVETILKGFVLVDVFDVGGQVVQNFKRKVTERLLGALDPLARVRLGEGDTQVLARSLKLTRFLSLGNIGFGRFRKGFEVLDTVPEIVVVDTGLEA